MKNEREGLLCNFCWPRITRINTNYSTLFGDLLLSTQRSL